MSVRLRKREVQVLCKLQLQHHILRNALSHPTRDSETQCSVLLLGL
jgi:hypothetical protein